MFGMPVISGKRAQKPGMCAVAQTEPRTKNSSVTALRVEPPPAVNSVPEAQPPPSCIPMPNMKAPRAEARPIGMITGYIFQPVRSW